ncbi:MAG: hypothetical protein RLZZ04_2377 [Cyanobacteriota bacterium]|jgi:cob(I)alamin adenosyltransferase
MNTQELETITKLSGKIDSLAVLIETGFSNVNNRLDSVDSRLHKVEEGILGLDRRLLVVETKATATDKHLDSLENRFNSFEGKLPDVNEKFGELKNWRQISFMILAAIAGWFARSGKF